MPGYRRALYRLEKAMPSGMAFFGFLMILFGIVGVLTTSSEIAERQISTDNRSQAAEPQNNLPNPPEGCWYVHGTCNEPNCVPGYELKCNLAPFRVAPARADGKILWDLPDAAMTADALRITTPDGQVFTTRDIVVRIDSDPIGVQGPNYTTIQGSWYEHGVEMRLNMYLYRNPATNVWYTDEIRVFNGEVDAEWAYFGKSANATTGEYIFSAPYGSAYQNPGTVTLTSVDPAGSATLSFTNLQLQAFLRKPPYCQEIGQRPADISGDEHVDILDITSLTSQFFQTGELDTDLTCDGVVDLRDYTLLINQLQP